MSNLSYWEKRKARETYEALELSEEAIAELKKVYVMASRDIAKEVQKIARRFQLKHKLTEKDAKRLLSKLKDKNDINKLIQQLKMNPQTADLAAELEAQAYAARIERLKATQTAVDTVTATIFSRAKKKFQFVLSKLAQGAYYKEIFGIQKRANAAFGIIPLDDKRIESVLKKPWSGDNYSKLLWKDTDRLAQTVKEQILIQILTGKRDHEIAQGIAESFGKGYNEARRLIRTESAYVTNQMAIEAYKDTGVDKYIYLAILDLRTSKICQKLDKKTFKVEDANVGENFPPMHPWCRSTTMAWMPPEILKKLKQRAWNPAKGEAVTVPGDMTYKEWFDKYVKGNAKKPPQSRTQAQGSRNLTQEQYDRYKKRLGSDFPFTYDEFIKMKSDKAKWAEYKKKYKDAGKTKKVYYEDITDKWYPDATPGSHKVEYMKEIEIDGQMCPVDGKKIQYEKGRNAEHEKKIGEMLARDIGGPVTMRPKINEPQGHPSADLEFNGVPYDIKTLSKDAGDNTIYNRVKKKKKQASRFIIDITAPNLSDEVVQEQIGKIFWSNETQFIKEIVIVKDYKVARVARKK